MEWLTDPQAWTAFAALALIEIVLGIDNIVFISVLVGKLPKSQQPRARFLGLGLAMLMRIALLFSLSWFMRVTLPLFTVLNNQISLRDLILIGGGLFLLAKATMEIHEKMEGEEGHATARGKTNFTGVLIQIALLDIVFSLDSVITAIGLSNQLIIMVLAIVLAVAVMMVSSGAISRFIDRHPTIKVLALSFLLLIGITLIAEGLEFHIPRGYIYFAMAFSIFVEMLNLKVRRYEPSPIQLHKAYKD